MKNCLLLFIMLVPLFSQFSYKQSFRRNYPDVIKLFFKSDPYDKLELEHELKYNGTITGEIYYFKIFSLVSDFVSQKNKTPYENNDKTEVIKDIKFEIRNTIVSNRNHQKISDLLEEKKIDLNEEQYYTSRISGLDFEIKGNENVINELEKNKRLVLNLGDFRVDEDRLKKQNTKADTDRDRIEKIGERKRKILNLLVNSSTNLELELLIEELINISNNKIDSMKQWFKKLEKSKLYTTIPQKIIRESKDQLEDYLKSKNIVKNMIKRRSHFNIKNLSDINKIKELDDATKEKTDQSPEELLEEEKELSKRRAAHRWSTQYTKWIKNEIKIQSVLKGFSSLASASKMKIFIKKEQKLIDKLIEIKDNL